MSAPKQIHGGVKSIAPLSLKNNSLSLQQFEDSYNILGEIIDNLDDLALKEISSGSAKDVDQIFSILLDEVTAVRAIYPNRRRNVALSFFELLYYGSSYRHDTCPSQYRVG